VYIDGFMTHKIKSSWIPRHRVEASHLIDLGRFADLRCMKFHFMEVQFFYVHFCPVTLPKFDENFVSILRVSASRMIYL
jgi:hypothetical protein